MRLLSGLVLFSLLVGCGETEIQKRLRLEKEALEANKIRTFLSCKIKPISHFSQPELRGWIHYELSRDPDSDVLEGYAYFLPSTTSSIFYTKTGFPKKSPIEDKEILGIRSSVYAGWALYDQNTITNQISLDRTSLELSWVGRTILDSSLKTQIYGGCKVQEKSVWDSERARLYSEYEQYDKSEDPRELERKSKLEARKI